MIFNGASALIMTTQLLISDTSIKPLEYLTSQNTRNISNEHIIYHDVTAYWTDIPDVQSHLVPNLF